MNLVALSQIREVIPSETLEEIDNAMLDLISLIEWRGDLDGIVERENVVTIDGKHWSCHIPEFTPGLPFSPTIYLSPQEELLEGEKPYEIYIANMINGPKSSKPEIAYWLTQIPQLVKKIIQEDLEKFSEKLPLSIPERLKSTGYTDL